MNPVARALLTGGILLIAAGLLWQYGSRLGLGHLPGDIVIRKGNVRIYIPIVTSVVLSALASLILYLFRRG